MVVTGEGGSDTHIKFLFLHYLLLSISWPPNSVITNPEALESWLFEAQLQLLPSQIDYFALMHFDGLLGHASRKFQGEIFSLKQKGFWHLSPLRDS